MVNHFIGEPVFGVDVMIHNCVYTPRGQCFQLGIGTMSKHLCAQAQKDHPVSQYTRPFKRWQTSRPDYIAVVGSIVAVYTAKNDLLGQLPVLGFAGRYS